MSETLPQSEGLESSRIDADEDNKVGSKETTTSPEGDFAVSPRQVERSLNNAYLERLRAALDAIAKEEYKGALTPEEAGKKRDEVRSLMQKVEEESFWPYKELSIERIEEQGDSQLESQTNVGILRTLPSGNIGFEVEGREYPFPSVDRIITHLTESPEFTELLARKEKQGFTRLRITPFAKPLQEMIDSVDDKVMSIGGENMLQSIAKDDSSELKYFTHLGANNTITGGETKSEILSHPEDFPFLLGGYMISIIEEGDDLPREEDSPETLSGRTRIKGGKTAIDYLEKFSSSESEYFGESPSITSEEWLCLFAEALYTKYLLPDKSIAKSGSEIFDTKSASWFIDSEFPSGNLPYGFWSDADRWFVLGGRRAGNSVGYFAPRPAVRKA